MPEPALYFLLDFRGTDSLAGDAYALVATAALADDARYLQVESVSAYRVSDGRMLAFDIVPRSGLIAVRDFGSAPIFATNTGNLRLRFAGDGERIGARDVRPGDSLVLRVVTEGTTLWGAVRVPMLPEPRIGIESGQRVVTWGSDANTAVWAVQTGFGGEVVRDTSFNLDEKLTRFQLENTDSIRVIAYDPNYTRYFVPPYRDIGGVAGGLGVVGAIVQSRAVALPPIP